MKTNYLMIFAILIIMFAMLTHPAICVTGAAAGLLTWFNSVLPSLFPFMVLTGLLIHTGSLNLLSKRLRQIPLLKNLPVTAVFAVITGLLCGYPMGIRTVSELKNSHQLSERQAKILYCFVNQPGPMFVLGYALPLCGFSSGQGTEFFTSFYGGIAFTAVLSLIISIIEKYFTSKCEIPHSPKYPLPDPPSVLSPDTAATSSVEAKQVPHFLSAFEEVLLSSMVTLGKIGGYMMLFSMIATLLGELLPNQPVLCLLFSGILEMTSGLALVPTIAQGQTAPTFVLGFIAFGGRSVAAQSFSLGDLSTREQLRYLLWKIIQVCVTLLIFAGQA